DVERAAAQRQQLDIARVVDLPRVAELDERAQARSHGWSWLEALQPVEPLQRRTAGRSIRALPPQADDDRVPLVKVPLQHLRALIVADAGFHLDAPERAVRREDVDGALLLRARVRRPGSDSVRTEAERADRDAEGLVALRRRDRDVGGHAGLELELRVLDRDDDVVGHDVLHGDGRVPHLRDLAVEGLTRVRIDGEGGGLPVAYAAHVGLAHVGVDLHLG